MMTWSFDMINALGVNNLARYKVLKAYRGLYSNGVSCIVTYCRINDQNLRPMSEPHFLVFSMIIKPVLSQGKLFVCMLVKVSEFKVVFC